MGNVMCLVALNCFLLSKIKDRFDGMPSGHTNSAWVAAAYIRTFSEDYQYASVPLYITAAVTGIAE